MTLQQRPQATFSTLQRRNNTNTKQILQRAKMRTHSLLTLADEYQSSLTKHINSISLLDKNIFESKYLGLKKRE